MVDLRHVKRVIRVKQLARSVVQPLYFWIESFSTASGVFDVVVAQLANPAW